MNTEDYKNVYVFAEQRNGVIQPVAYELLGKACDLAASLGEKVVAVLLGCGIKDQAQKPTQIEERRVGKECRSRWSPYH